MNQITSRGAIYNLHPIYDSYASDEAGNIFDINKKAHIRGHNHKGYLYINFKNMGLRVQYIIHRFVWECFNGVVPEGSVIEHINNNKRNNTLSNLRLVSQKVQEYNELENDVIEDIVIEIEDEIVIVI